MKAFRPLFSPTVIAEMRGISNEHGRSPFWEAVGHHFFHLSFAQADRLTLKSGKAFIADLMPTYPLYVSLLPKRAQAVIAQTHPATVPAMNILYHEGFQHQAHIDIFDAGPILEAFFDDILTIEHTQCLPIQISDRPLNGQTALLSNTACANFRATQALVQRNPHHDKLILDPQTATLLQLEPDEPVQFIFDPPRCSA